MHGLTSSEGSENQESKVKTLIITSAGGSGHITAAEAHFKKIYSSNEKMKKKAMHYVLPKEPIKSSWLKLYLFNYDFGNKGVKDWNKAQRANNVKEVKRLVAWQWV